MASSRFPGVARPLTKIKDGFQVTIPSAIAKQLHLSVGDILETAAVMEFMPTGDVERSIRRIALRMEDGGHGAPPARIRSSYLASLMNLPRALREFDFVRIQ